MRVPLLIAVATLTASCSTPRDQPSLATQTESSIESPATSAINPDRSRPDPQLDTPTPLVGANLDHLPTTPDVVLDPTFVHELAHFHHEEEFAGPAPLPDSPSPVGDPLDLFTWIGLASLNYGLDQPFPDPRLHGLLAPTLLPQQSERSIELLTANSSHAVLLDGWIDPESSTSTLVHGVVIFERTLGTGTHADHQIEIVSIALTAHATPNGWQIIDLRAKS